MHLVYVDEVKPDGIIEPYYWLCGLAIPEADIQSIEKSLNAVAVDFFGSKLLDVNTEFHASAIIQGKGPYKGRGVTDRLNLIKRIVEVIPAHPNTGRIEVRLNPKKMSAEDCQSVAFMFLIERVDQLMRARGSLALLIADQDKQFVGVNVRNLSAYKQAGTKFAFGQDIKHVVDTVHHTQSHHSRLLQLADIYAYSVALSDKKIETQPRADYARHVRGLDPFWPTKYKYWPG